MLVPILIAISGAAAIALLALVIVLFRDLKRLAGSVQILNEEVLPLAERLREEAEEVRVRLDRLDDRAEEMRRRAERRAEGVGGLGRGRR
jgi:hypothetical protein